VRGTGWSAIEGLVVVDARPRAYGGRFGLDWRTAGTPPRRGGSAYGPVDGGDGEFAVTEIPMRIRSTLPALVLALVPFVSAAADEVVGGCSCNNECPLAQEANKHRSTGTEALATSAVVRAEYVKVVRKALATI
jgi:hypothetical protein